MRRTLFSALFLVTTLLPAQALPSGYADQLEALPASASHVLALGNGLTAWFDGTDLTLTGAGQPRSLLHFATPVFGSFVLQLDPNTLMFGESSSHGIWLVPVFGASPTQPFANLTLNYDAVRFDAQYAIVSARTSGFGGSTNDLIAVDVQAGTTQVLATLPGASGPVAVDGNGDLHYATSALTFPTPPGQTDVLRFSRATIYQALTSQQVLGIAQAQTIVTGLDSASDLAFDDDDDLFFVDWFNARVGEIDDAGALNPVTKTFVDYGSAPFGPAGLQFVSSSNEGVFEPFQPIGRELRVHETAFGTLSQVRTMSPASPALMASTSAPIVSGPFALLIGDGPAGGIGLLAIGLPTAGNLAQVTVAGFEQPLFWHAALLPASASWIVSFDGGGNASLGLTNPGFASPLTLVTQGAVLDPNAGAVGATAPATLTLVQ